MVQKYFLGLDLPNNEILPVGTDALNFIEKSYGTDFLTGKVGVKINDRDLRGGHEKFREFKDRGCDIFGDIKIHHGANTGYPIIENVGKELPLDYVTVYAGLGEKILKEYIERGEGDGVKIIGFTVHTKIPPKDVGNIYNQSVSDAVYTLGKIASDSGCDAIVCEGPMLEDERIRELPIKNLITGMRFDPEDRGAQARVTSMDQLEGVKDCVDYLVISKRYLQDFGKLGEILQRIES